MPGKMMKPVILWKVSRHMKDGKMVRNRQGGFTKAKSHLTNLITMYSEWNGLIDNGKELDIVNLDFSKAFNIFVSSLIPSLISFS